MNRIISHFHICARSPSSSRGSLVVGDRSFPCLLGKSGMRHAKREGDGATPTGKFRLLHGYYRPDRLARSRTHIPMQTLKEHLGWCDASGHRLYNRPVHLPCDQSHEIMARSDGAYDVVIVLDYNIAPRRQGRGSAIFLHLIREGAAHTEGCIAVSRDTMRKLLPLLGWKTRILIGSNPVPRK